jgi:hypothetical protein
LSCRRILACLVVLLVAACGDDKPKSYDIPAMDASYRGDYKTAIALARKEVARFATADQCSTAQNINCGTLALAYGSLTQYQIAAGDRAGAKAAMSIMDRNYLPSTAGVVYRDVSEAYWKVGDKARAKEIIEQGRLAGGDTWLAGSSAGQAIIREKAREKEEREKAGRDAVDPAVPGPAAQLAPALKNPAMSTATTLLPK